MPLCSRFYKFNQKLGGCYFGQETVELIKQFGGIDRAACFRSPEGAPRHLYLVAIGQEFEGAGTARDARQGEELRGHRAGTHCRHAD